jgi:prepilin-type N-terminal cleavage/methylation domain-containing protein
MRHKQGFTLLELLIVLFVVSILAAMLFPVFARARESAHKVTCLSSLVQLGNALQLYAADWSGTLPPKDNDWGPLDPYTRNAAVFQCLSDPAIAALQSEPDSSSQEPVRIPSSYVYRSGLTNDGLPMEIVAFDRGIWHLGGRSVVFLDAHGTWFNAAAFWQMVPERVLALDPALQALTPEQRKAAREGQQIPGKVPWR